VKNYTFPSLKNIQADITVKYVVLEKGSHIRSSIQNRRKGELAYFWK
jgi:hypothetical protein